MRKKRKITAIITIIVVMSCIMAMPVMAQEVTDPQKVIKEETFNAGEDALAREFHASQIWRSDNYAKYLDGVIYNLNETVRIKQEIVNNYKHLSQYNPYFATLLPDAQKDLAEAQAWVDYYKTYKNKVQADFRVKYPR